METPTLVGPTGSQPFYTRIPSSWAKGFIWVGVAVLILAGITTLVATSHIQKRSAWKEQFREHTMFRSRVPHPGLYTTDWHDVQSQRFQLEIAKHSFCFGLVLVGAGMLILLAKRSHHKACIVPEDPVS